MHAYILCSLGVPASADWKPHQQDNLFWDINPLLLWESSQEMSEKTYKEYAPWRIHFYVVVSICIYVYISCIFQQFLMPLLTVQSHKISRRLWLVPGRLSHLMFVYPFFIFLCVHHHGDNCFGINLFLCYYF